MADTYRQGLAKLQNNSYSSLLTLHSCPRRFELDKRTADTNGAIINENVDFAYGHALAAGVQSYLLHKDVELAKWSLFLAWDCDMLADKPKAKKDIWNCCYALDIFIARKEEFIGDDWEVAYFHGKPAVELSFKIVIGNGHQFFGHIDLVLVNKRTGKFMVLELKTTSFTTVEESLYKNSAQALGYSIVLDKIAAELAGAAHYEVLYLPYLTSAQVYQPMVFTKTHVQRAAWIKHLLLDCEIINLYQKHDFFPMNGESCYAFFRTCEYFDLCQLSNRAFPPLKQRTAEDDDANEEQILEVFTFKLADIIEHQKGQVA
jgi:hypothetical protein